MMSLIDAAKAAREHAHAPYSGFQVGAALLAMDGAFVTGCNVESASYGLTICAERVAIMKGVSEGRKLFTEVVIVTDAERLTPPCGACRQILWEFAPDAVVRLRNLAGEEKRYMMRDLFPDAFDAASIETKS
jgi:cytidine deaminase